jgi:hypothetical protein
MLSSPQTQNLTYADLTIAVYTEFIGLEQRWPT